MYRFIEIFHASHFNADLLCPPEESGEREFTGYAR